MRLGLLLSVLALALGVSPAWSQNLLANAEFSEWADDSTPAQTRPTDWVPEYRPSAGVFREAGNVQSGPFAARIVRRVDSTGNNSGVRQDSVPVVGGEVYTIAAWLKVDTIPDGTVRYTSGRVVVTWRDAAGSTIRSTNPSYVTSSNWVRQSYADTAPANAAMATFMIRCYGRSNPRSLSGGIVYCDDASLTRGTAIRESGERADAGCRLAVAPNPFRGATIIRPAPGVRNAAGLRIYDATGQVVRTLRENPDPGGEFCWDGTDETDRELPGGIYFAVIETTDGAAPVHRLVMMR
jgi:hypothetical protein